MYYTFHTITRTHVCTERGFRCNTGDSRLTGGANEHVGRVELCIDNVFTPLCGLYFDRIWKKWGDADAQVVCNQLGFPSTLNGMYVMHNYH